MNRPHILGHCNYRGKKTKEFPVASNTSILIIKVLIQLFVALRKWVGRSQGHHIPLLNQRL